MGHPAMEAIAILLLLCALGWSRFHARRAAEHRFLSRDRALTSRGPTWNHPAQPPPGP